MSNEALFLLVVYLSGPPIFHLGWNHRRTNAVSIWESFLCYLKQFAIFRVLLLIIIMGKHSLPTSHAESITHSRLSSVLKFACHGFKVLKVFSSSFVFATILIVSGHWNVVILIWMVVENSYIVFVKVTFYIELLVYRVQLLLRSFSRFDESAITLDVSDCFTLTIHKYKVFEAQILVFLILQIYQRRQRVLLEIFGHFIILNCSSHSFYI